MSWTSRRRWRAACRHLAQAACTRAIARALLLAHREHPQHRSHIAWLQACLANERDRIPWRLFAAATRELARYCRGEVASIDRERRAL